MASFYAFDFMFDNVPSAKFDLKIITFEDGGLFNGVGSSDIEVISQNVLRKSKPYYLGRTQPAVLEFPLTFGTARPISGMERDLISQWLFGRSGYKKLYIMQDDLNGAYFNCFMTAPQPLYIGGMNYAFTCTVKCDSPWAYLPQRTFTKTFIGQTDYTFSIYNHSSDDEPLYPTIIFKTWEDSVFYLCHLNNQYDIVDNPYGRIFSINLLSFPNQRVIVDNDLQIITSTLDGIPVTGTLAHFNKKWLQLLPKKNDFLLTTSVKYLTITYTERLKIGG